MNIIETLKAKFAGNQAVLDEIAAEEAQQAEQVPAQDQAAAEQGAAEQVAQVVAVTDPNRPQARFATLCEAYDREHGVQA